MNEADFVEYLKATPPTCIAGFTATPAELPEPWDDNVCSVWRLACTCGGAVGRFLGYPLSDYAPDYQGPLFIGPLSFQCDACQSVTRLLDTDIHGYHADLDRREGGEQNPVKMRGGGPPRAFRCPDCTGESFIVTVGFVFWHADELAEEFDSAWEDLFNVFLCHCRCQACGRVSEPTDFGKL